MTEQQTAANDLDQAAADAVKEETQETPAAETQIQEKELPQDHQERSDLGRKISAMHRRQDDFDDRFDRLLTLMESQATNPKQETNDDWFHQEEEKYLTAKDLIRVLDARDSEKERRIKSENDRYTQTYLKTLKRLSSTLDEGEAEKVISELQNLKYNPTKDADADARDNFYRAHVNILRGSKTEKINPLQNNEAPGVITNQKTVTKEPALPKLSGPAQSYLNYVANTDGSEKATKLHKSLA